MELLTAKGFGQRWMTRIAMVSNTGFLLYCLMVTENLENNFCARGARQGYPLSPLIFVLAAGLLRSIFSEHMHTHLADSPLRHTSCHHPIIKYANGVKQRISCLVVTC